MGWLLLIGIAALVYYFVKADSQKGDVQNVPTVNQLEQRNAEWAQFIAGYHAVAKTKAEKKLVERMLEDLGKQGLPVPIVGDMGAVPSLAVATEKTEPVLATSTILDEPTPNLLSETEARNVQLDNASLLLYFGAFLFVASVGLFVAFGGLPGTLRTLAVALVAGVMYIGGIWLFRNKPKQEQAGLAFAGIGLATAPFVGLAAYNFVFAQSAGSTVWFITSLGCMALYLHALVTLRKPLLNYVLIFTLLSLVESGVSIINTPLYYFGWALAATGLLLSVVSRQRGFGDEFQDAAGNSAKLLMPLASFTSLVMAFSQGSVQLGISLLIAAAYYATEFWYGRKQDQVENAMAGQFAATGAVVALSYGVWHEVNAIAGALLVFVILQTAALLIRSKTASLIWQNFGSIAALAGVVAVLFSFGAASLLAANLAALTLLCAALWLLQDRTDAYILGIISWMLLPLAVGQQLLVPHLTLAQQVALMFAFLSVEWAVLLAAAPKQAEGWLETAKLMYVLSSAAVVWASLLTAPMVSILVCVGVALSMVLLAEHGHGHDWSSIAGIVVTVPILASHDDHTLFLLAVAGALVANIAMALRYRQELTRWLSTGLWLLMPVALGDGALGYWTTAEFAWAYVVVMAGLVFSRAVARGKLFVSSNVPVVSYARSASLSYVTGYCLAGGLAVVISLFAEKSHFHTSLILSVLMGAVWLLARFIEQRDDMYILLPVLAQLILLSVLRIDVSSPNFDIYLLLSTLLAGAGYVSYFEAETGATFALRDGFLLTAAVTPLSFMFVGETRFMMPVGLLVLSGLLYHRMRETGQANRELIGGLALISIWWFMWFTGVRNLQAYTHVLAALFAAYAYWRHIRGDVTNTDNYLLAMLATATVPLALQALGGTAGDLYGWWLLLEQVFFMLLGMSIGKSLVTRWGLYVAIGAVLYQLRHLGWAALTVLALFIIGLAMYRLQKLDDKK